MLKKKTSASSAELEKLKKDLELRISVINAIDATAHLGMWYAEYNDAGEITSVKFSDEFRRILHVSKEEMPDQSDAFQKIVHPDDLMPMLTLMGAVQADKTNRTKYDINYRMAVKGEGYIWFHALGDMIRQPDGTPRLMLGFFERIHEKMIMEEELAVSSNRSFAVEKMMLEGSWSMDLTKYAIDDLKSPMVFSDQFKNLLGYSSREFPDVMESWITRIHPDDVGEASALIAKQLANPHETIPFDMIYRIKHKSGDYHWFRASSYIVWNKERTKPVMAAGTILDVTDERVNKDRFTTDLRPAINSLNEEIETVSERIHTETQNTLEIAKRQESISSAAGSIEKAVTNSMGIIKQIQDIADQTNILSINASIEAARTGEAGKGFAVVAQEVRTLADKTTATTKNIAGILQGINDEVKSVIEQITEINSYISEQSGNMQGINDAVLKLNEFVSTIDSMTSNLYK